MLFRSPKALAGQMASDVPFHSEIEGDDVGRIGRRFRALSVAGEIPEGMEAGIPGRSGRRDDFANQIATDQRGAGSRPLDELLVIENLAGDYPAQGTLGPDFSNQGSGVDVANTNNPMSTEEFTEQANGAVVAGYRAGVSYHKSQIGRAHV